MLVTECIHPQIMAALALCGHGSKILIADGNYPLWQKSGGAQKVFLGLHRGLPTVTDVLQTLLTAVNVERAEVMMPDAGPEPEIFEEFRRQLPDVALDALDRQSFYDACMSDAALVLAIATGEQRTYANMLLTVGCA